MPRVSKKYTEEEKEALAETERTGALLRLNSKIKEAFESLIENGNERAILQGQKQVHDLERMQGQEMQDKMTKALIELCPTRRTVLGYLSDLFGMTVTTSERQYQRVLEMYKLESPSERAKRLKQESKGDLMERFASGDMTEIELLRYQMAEMIAQQAAAEYASEKVATSKQMLEITRRIDEIEDRKRKEAERSQYDIADLVDAQLLQVSPEMVVEFKSSRLCLDYLEPQAETKADEEDEGLDDE